MSPKRQGQGAGLRGRLLRALEQARGRARLPAEVVAGPVPKLLHVSDTPSVVYPALFRLIERLQPDVLVHTGDLADQLKLETHAFLRPVYAAEVARLVARLESAPVGTIYIVPGNHDDPELLTLLSRRCRILPGGSSIRFGPFKLGLAHRPEEVPAGSDFALYGHSPDLPPPAGGRPLSGLAGMNILLVTGEVYGLPYPPGTDYARRARVRPTKL